MRDACRRIPFDCGPASLGFGWEWGTQAKEARGKDIQRLAGLTPFPNVLLVRGPVDRLVQDALHAHGITLVQGLKLSLMHRLARSTGAEVRCGLTPPLVFDSETQREREGGAREGGMCV